MGILTLSGGGFRATFFHLGVARYLAEKGLLNQITHIFSVSGGSVLAAHMVKNWEAYVNPATFGTVASQLVDLARSDMRGRIVRKWLFLRVLILFCSVVVAQLLWFLPDLPSFARWGGLVPLLGGTATFWYFRRRWSRVAFLADAYDQRLFNSCTLGSLVKRDICILATNLTTASVSWFTNKGYGGIIDGEARVIGNPEMKVSTAVAASSAYPALFEPVEITSLNVARNRTQFPNNHYLSDGGLFDNLGVHAMRVLHPNLHGDAPIFISDAGGVCDATFHTSFPFLVGRTLRITDIFMRRIGDLEQALHIADAQGTLITLSKPVQVDRALNEELQYDARNMRTDFDEFSPLEIQVLYYHGYTAAMEMLDPGGRINGFSFDANGVPIAVELDSSRWLPIKNHEATYWPNPHGLMAKSGRHSIGVFRPSNAVSWAIALFIVFGILLTRPVLTRIASYLPFLPKEKDLDLKTAYFDSNVAEYREDVQRRTIAKVETLFNVAQAQLDGTTSAKRFVVKSKPLQKWLRPVHSFRLLMNCKALGARIVDAEAFLCNNALDPHRHKPLKCPCESSGVSIDVADVEKHDYLLVFVLVATDAAWSPQSEIFSYKVEEDQ
jgi:predicted acylesterase/phospholipase RssA